METSVAEPAGKMNRPYTAETISTETTSKTDPAEAVSETTSGDSATEAASVETSTAKPSASAVPTSTSPAAASQCSMDWRYQSSRSSATTAIAGIFLIALLLFLRSSKLMHKILKQTWVYSVCPRKREVAFYLVVKCVTSPLVERSYCLL
jgi:hypothetical protein